MDTKVNYTIVGLFVVALTAIIIIATVWISGGQHTKTYNYFLTFANEAVDGLTEKSPVKFNGVDVGYVENININPHNPQEIRLVLKIETKTPINQSTVATIKSQGITGFTYVALHASEKEAPPLRKSNKLPYPVIRYSASIFMQLDKIAQNLAQNFSKASDSLTQFFGEENQKSIAKLLNNLSNLADTLEKNSTSIENSIKYSDQFLKNTAKASDSFAETIEALNATLAEARNTSKQLTGLSITAKQAITSSNESVKDFSEQTLPNAYNALTKLKNILGNLESLSEELNQNPSILVRGKTAQPAGPGE